MGFREMFASNDPVGRGSILARVESEPITGRSAGPLFRKKRTLPLVFAELLGHGRSEELLDPPAPPAVRPANSTATRSRTKKTRRRDGGDRSTRGPLVAAAIPLLRLKKRPAGMRGVC